MTVSEGQTSVNVDMVPLSRRLEAVGRLLEKRGHPIKELCVLQAGSGFIIHGLEMRYGRESSSFVSVTIQIEPEALVSVLMEDEAARHVATPEETRQPWWRRS